MNPLRIFLMATLFLVVFSSGDVEAKEALWEYNTGNIMMTVAISEDGEHIVAGNRDGGNGTGKVYLFDKDNKPPLWNHEGEWIDSVAISADGEYIVASSIQDDDKLYFFNKANSTPLWTYDVDEVITVAISADGEYIVAGSGPYSTTDRVYLFNKNSSTPLWSYATEDNVHSVAISADGEYIAAGTKDHKVHLFNKNSSTPLWSYDVMRSVSSVAISADGEYIVAGSSYSDTKVYLFNKNSSTPLWSYYTGGNDPTSVDISADGEYIAVGTYHRSEDANGVYLFNKNSSTPLWRYTFDNLESDDYSAIVAISADGKYIAVGSTDTGRDNGYISLHGKDSSTPLWSYNAGDSVASVAISGDGEYIAAVSQNHRVHLLNKNVPPSAFITISPDSLGGITPTYCGCWDITFSANDSYDPDGTIVAYRWWSGNELVSENVTWISQEEELDDGYHQIKLEVQDDYGVWSGKLSVNFKIVSDLPPTASASVEPSGVEIGNPVHLNGSAVEGCGKITTYGWYVNNEIISNEPNSQWIATGEGSHFILFRVEDDNGALDEWETWIQVTNPNIPPVAVIDSITPSPGRFDDEIAFRGIGTDVDGNDTISAYEWTSSIDGFLSSEKNFSVTGLSIGDHIISFRVQDNDSIFPKQWSEWVTAVLIINPNSPPVGIIDSINPSPAEEGTSVSFSSTGSDSDGTVVTYLWTSSIEGVLSSDEDFSISNLSLGHHTIIFLVQDNDGGWSESVDALFWVYTVPVPNAGADLEIAVHIPVQFDGKGTDEDGNIVKYEWDFDGDGTYDWSSEEHGLFSYSYNYAGNFSAILRLTDNDGFTSTDIRNVTVLSPDEVIDKYDGNQTEGGGGGDETPAPSILISSMMLLLIARYRRK